MSNTTIEGCKIEGCKSPGRPDRNGVRKFYLGLCGKHLTRRQRYGDVHFLNHPQDGRTKHPLYKTWTNMKNRCSCKEYKYYEDYGGRGITMCDRWRDKVHGFPNFLEDIGERPSKSHTIDRIDNNGNYEPGNVRWATKREQNLNRRLLKRNKSGHTGIEYNSTHKRWRPRISTIDGKSLYLGSYKTLDEALEVRRQAEVQHGYNHGSRAFKR